MSTCITPKCAGTVIDGHVYCEACNFKLCLCGAPKPPPCESKKGRKGVASHALYCDTCRVSQLQQRKNVLREALGLAGRDTIRDRLGLNYREIWMIFVNRNCLDELHADACRDIIAEINARPEHRTPRAEAFLRSVA